MKLFGGRRGAAKTAAQDAGRNTDMHMSLAQLRTALNALPMGVIVVDQEGTEWWRNRSAHGIIDAATNGDEVRGVLADLARSAMRGRGDLVSIDIDGPPQRKIEARSISMVNGGALVVLEDVTERELIDKVRTDFVANISHELKTPVGALSILAETIIGEAEASGEDSDIVPLAKRMVDESHRVARIIDDLLELASIEFRSEQKSEVISMTKVVSEAIARNSPRAERLGITVVADLPPDESHVRGDSTQIVSAVANLVENAVKYSERGDSVTVVLRSTETDVVLEVIDEGIGIPAEHVERVFERFYRADSARSRATGGTGLGLSIVRHVATNHGGEVNVRSRTGEGSTFTMVLPRFHPDNDGTMGADDNRADGNG